MIQGCSKGVLRIFQGCFKGVSSVFQGCFNGDSNMSQGCFKDVSWVFQGCFKGGLRKLQRILEQVLREGFKRISRKFQGVSRIIL